MKEPTKGSFYLIPFHACFDKPKYGTRVCQFEKREYVGCQLHGELTAYAYVFKLNPKDDHGSIRVLIKCDEGTPQQKILEELYSKIKPYGDSV